MSQSDTENVGAASPQKQGFSDFRNTFQPFYVGRNMKLAPINYFGHDKEAVDYLCSRIDDALQASDPFEEHNKPLHASDLLRLIPHKKPRRIKGQASVRDIMAELEAEREQVIDLTGPQLTSQSSARQKLSKVPTKILFYHRDERPAYHGTFTRPIPEKSALKLTRNPFERAIPSIEYDYDSEAEWEPPAEGDEDLNSDEEDVGSEEGEEDMEDFLDDEEDSGKGRIVGDMRPRCSGLRWADEVDNRHVDDEFDMNRMRLEIIAGGSIQHFLALTLLKLSRLIRSDRSLLDRLLGKDHKAVLFASQSSRCFALNEPSTSASSDYTTNRCPHQQG